jgi:hypothetical protein
MCCNGAYVNKNHEFITPSNSNASRVKVQSNKEDKENYNPNHLHNNHNIAIFEGEMHITDRQDNDQIVKHIRTTSSVNKSVIDYNRIR